MSTINKLRSLIGSGYSTYDDDNYEEIDCIFDFPDGYTVELVDKQFEEGGRWSNYEAKVFKITEHGHIAYFEFGREVPASETQDGMDCSWHLKEVEPYEVTVVKYRAKR